MPIVLPVRLSADARTATWNPALTRESHVLVEVRTESGELVTRTSLNSGRVRVREVERIERVLTAS
jgi:hypothetical protein